VEVAELLGLLPLALEQTGGYVRETRIALAAYLQRLLVEMVEIVFQRGMRSAQDAKRSAVIGVDGRGRKL
jgi:hypothetical protein